MRFLSSDFFHESIGNRPLSNPQKYFQKYFVFVEIFTKKFFFHSNFWVMIPGGCTISGYRNPEVVQPPGYNIQRLHNLWIMISGGCECELFCKLLLTNHNEIMAKFDKISDYSYPEVV